MPPSISQPLTPLLRGEWEAVSPPPGEAGPLDEGQSLHKEESHSQHLGVARDRAG